MPGLKRCGFFTPPVDGGALRAAFEARFLRGDLPPVDLRAVCFVRAISEVVKAPNTTLLNSVPQNIFTQIGILVCGRATKGCF